MKFKIFPILLIFLIIVNSTVFADNNTEFSITTKNSNQEEICGKGTIKSPETGKCIPDCREGSVLTTEGACEKIESEPEDIFLGLTTEIGIFIGVVTGIGATVFGIAWTVKTRKEEQKKESLEIIQKYGEELTKVINTEKDLQTKFDCELYAEQYLNILEQIASLYHKKMLRYEVAEYFENYFRYGISLWKWYKRNVEKCPDYEIELQFIEGLKGHENLSEAAKSRLQSDRWFYFRWVCYGGDYNI